MNVCVEIAYFRRYLYVCYIVTQQVYPGFEVLTAVKMPVVFWVVLELQWLHVPAKR
jgi:hypothetical protein